MRNENRSCRPWQSTSAPGRILLIRLHAIGDVALTLPALAALHHRFPQARIDYLTGGGCKGLLEPLSSIDRVIIAPTAQSSWQRLMGTLALASSLGARSYDLVIDLQRNWSTRGLRRLLRPSAWSEFDRFSPQPAAARVLKAFREAGFPGMTPAYRLPLRAPLLENARHLLLSEGWDGVIPLIVLNPAGLWPTRNWPTENYVTLARLWLEREAIRFLLMGTGERLGKAASYIKENLGTAALNMVGKTSLAEALGVLRFTSGVISEDSGLLHMAWASGLPSLAIFGSSNHLWAGPVGNHGQSLNSGDLECGACMQPQCRFGDVHCLTRYSPEVVLATMQDLLKRCSVRSGAL